MLSQAQHEFYRTFGFLVFKQCFSPAEIEEIGRQFDDLMAEGATARRSTASSGRS